jgi:hypothetical protein
VFTQLTLVHRENLRDNNDTLLREVGFTRFERDITRRICTVEIGSQRTDNHRIDAATVENVVLNDHMWMTIAGARAGRFVKVNPENIALITIRSLQHCDAGVAFCEGAFAQWRRAHLGRLG